MTSTEYYAKCLACGAVAYADYCPDCVTSGQADYDRADRAGQTLTAKHIEYSVSCAACGTVDAPLHDAVGRVLCADCDTYTTEEN